MTLPSGAVEHRQRGATRDRRHRGPARARPRRRVGVEPRQGRRRRRHARRSRPRARRRRHRRRRGTAGPASPTASSTPPGRTPACSRRWPTSSASCGRASTSCRRARCSSSTRGVPWARRCTAASVAAAEEGGVSLWVNGVDPGFANDWLPLVMTSVCERIDEVRCMEVLNYATYDQPEVLFDIMGFGQSMDEVPFILSPGILTTAWGSVVAQLAAGPRRHPRRDRRVARAGARARGVRRRVRADRGGHDGRRCASRCAAWSAARRRSCSSTSPGCATTSPPTGRSRQATAATAS